MYENVDCCEHSCKYKTIQEPDNRLDINYLHSLFKHASFSLSLQAAPAQHMVIDMDQRNDLLELTYLMELAPCNISDGDTSMYNFSQSTAHAMIIEYRDRMLTIQEPTTIALLCLYIPTFLFALGGNMLVVYVVFRNPHMRRVKNLFLVNLAIADIAVTLVCIPMVAGQTVFRIWVYGEFMCKVSGYMQGMILWR